MNDINTKSGPLCPLCEGATIFDYALTSRTTSPDEEDVFEEVWWCEKCCEGTPVNQLVQEEE